MSARRGVAILAPAEFEGALVQAIDAEAGPLVVVRRCADLAEVRAAARAGLAGLGVVDGEDPDLDAVVVEELHEEGMAVLVLAGPREVGPLRAMGADAVVGPGHPQEVVQALLDLVESASLPGAQPGGGHTTATGEVGASVSPAGTTVPPGAPTGEPGEPEGTGQLLAVWGTSGAPGRSTVALNLASVLARGRKVVLVDADTSSPSLAHMLGLPVDAPGLAALSRFAARGALGEEEAGRALVPVSDGLAVLTGLSVPQRWNEVSPESVRAVLEVLGRIADLVVVDLPAGTLDPVPARTRQRGSRDEVVAAVLRVVGSALVVCRGDPVGINRLALSHQWWEELGAPSSPVVVANQISREASGRRPATAVAHAVSVVLPDRRVHLVPRDEAVPAALLRAGPVVDLSPGCEASRALVALAEDVGGVGGGGAGRAGRRGRVRG